MPRQDKYLGDTYLTLDCEFTETGNVREIAIILYKGNLIVRVLEVVISSLGKQFVKYDPQQINYHLGDTSALNQCIDSFLKTCIVYAPLKTIRMVGMSIESDLSALFKTTGSYSLLNEISKKTDLEICGRGTLETKANTHHITHQEIKDVLGKLIKGTHRGKYSYHTALYDAIITGFVYIRLKDSEEVLRVHNRFEKCKHSFFSDYYKEQLAKTKAKTKDKQKDDLAPKADRVTPKNFPDIRYKVQKNISNVFDIVPREILYSKLSAMRYEPSIQKGYRIKMDIMKNVYAARKQVEEYDTGQFITDPYNIALVHGGVTLAQKRISVEDFIDFAIYLQQYNLPKDKGTYYKVSDSSQKKEIYVRCLKETTAKKLLVKRPYCTIEQFLSKEIPICQVEVLTEN